MSVKAALKVAAQAVWAYLRSPEAKRWEIPLLSAVGYYIAHLFQQL